MRLPLLLLTLLTSSTAAFDLLASLGFDYPSLDDSPILNNDPHPPSVSYAEPKPTVGFMEMPSFERPIQQFIPDHLQQFIMEMSNGSGAGPSHGDSDLERRQVAAGGAAAPAAPAAPVAGGGVAPAAPAAPAAGAGAGVQPPAAPVVPGAAPAAAGGVGGGGPAQAQPGNPAQLSPITTYEIDGKQFVYTQTFAPTPDPWDPPQTGSVGLGTLTGTVGAVKTAAAERVHVRGRGMGAVGVGVVVGGALAL